MKKLITSVIALTILTGAIAQKQINLNLNHHFNGDSFVYDSNYETEDGKVVKFTRIQYYLSGVNLKHDGNQTLDLSDTYILASGNVTNYDLGTQNINELEAVKFDLGVDYDNNHNGASNWPAEHPLATQAPSMDWGWPAGYFFFVIDGNIDDNGDGTPNKYFSLRGLGDQLLTSVNELETVSSDATIDINLFVNIADWIKNVDLVTAGSQHNADSYTTKVATNSNDETVFTTEIAASIDEFNSTKENKLYADYQLSYAPTIYYTISTSKNLTAKIYDASGKVVFIKSDLNSEGNFFINKELNSGIYTVVFENLEVSESLKISITK